MIFAPNQQILKKINITLEFVKCKYRLEVETSVAIWGNVDPA